MQALGPGSPRAWGLRRAAADAGPPAAKKKCFIVPKSVQSVRIINRAFEFSVLLFRVL